MYARTRAHAHSFKNYFKYINFKKKYIYIHEIDFIQNHIVF